DNASQCVSRSAGCIRHHQGNRLVGIGSCGQGGGGQEGQGEGANGSFHSCLPGSLCALPTDVCSLAYCGMTFHLIQHCRTLRNTFYIMKWDMKGQLGPPSGHAMSRGPAPLFCSAKSVFQE